MRYPAAIVISLLALSATPVFAQFCEPGEMTRDDLSAWRDNGFRTETPDASVIALVGCLAEPDPFLRDRIGYEGISTLLRTADIGVETRRQLMTNLMVATTGPDPAGTAIPFAVLALSEVVRTDRTQAFLSPAERSALVKLAADYLGDVDDYRGFVDGEGWRHGVAHGADLALQLVLNPQVSDAQVLALTGAAFSQVNPSTTHAYVFGEPRRLARPVLYGALRETIDATTWSDLFAEITNPAALGSWQDAFASEAGLAKLHNTRAFAQAVYIAASTSGMDQLGPVAAEAKKLLEQLP